MCNPDFRLFDMFSDGEFQNSTLVNSFWLMQRNFYIIWRWEEGLGVPRIWRFCRWGDRMKMKRTRRRNFGGYIVGIGDFEMLGFLGFWGVGVVWLVRIDPSRQVSMDERRERMGEFRKRSNGKKMFGKV